MGTARMLLPSLAELILHHVAMKELGAEELWAQACIQQAWPDCQVAQYDDGSRPSMYDLKITYPDGSIGALEVTAAADAEQVELWKLDYAVELALLDADSIRAINGGVYPPKWPSGPGTAWMCSCGSMPGAWWARTSLPSAASAKRCARTA